MKESYLHLLWMQRRLPFHLLTLMDGREFRVIHPGNFNRTESGPDFTDARIEIDGLTWVGSVELHINSSDWYKHGHHNDPAYNSVILHVVHRQDRDVLIEGEKIPALELQQFIDYSHYNNFLKFLGAPKKLPCQQHLPTIEHVFIRSMLEKCVIQRYKNKMDRLAHSEMSTDPSHLFFQLLCSSFGLKVNNHPFHELAIRIPFGTFKKIDPEEKRNLIRITSGLWEISEESIVQTSKSLLRSFKAGVRETVSPSSWKRKGLRPGSDPIKRIDQLSRFASKIRYEEFDHFSDEKQLLSHLKDVFNRTNSEVEHTVGKLSPYILDQIIINAFVPFLFAVSKQSPDKAHAEFALELLDNLSPERNNVVDFWITSGFVPRSALETQGLLELDKSYCQRKKCLNCTIGMKVLGG